MRKYILLMVLLVCSASNAQFNFSKQTVMENSNTSEGVTTIQSVDIDGDGDKDLLSGDAYNVKWFENIGGNNAQLVSHKIADFGANFCSFADIDRDGDLDIIAQSYGTVYWIQNNDGHGNFNAPSLLTTTSTIYSISVVDFDLDNDLDIVYSYSDFNYSGLSWLENTTGQGAFTNRIISQYSKSRAIYAIDIDRDNDVDVFSFNNDTQKIELFTNNGAFNFTTQVITSARENGYGTMNFSDIDNDNDLDLIVSNSAGYTDSIEELNIFKNNGTGNFTFFKTLVTNGTGLSYIITKDLDHDNDLDIVVSCYNDDKLSWFKNNDGQGNFGSIQVINNRLNGAKSICAYDFDGDSYIDVLSASQLDDKIVWHKNLNGLGNFDVEKNLTRSINDPVKSISADIDNDGDKDVITISEGDGKVSWYKNLDGHGTFGVQNLVESEFTGFGNVVAIDLDHDGDIDIASGENNTNYHDLLSWYENLDGQGNFSTRKEIHGPHFGYCDGVAGLSTDDLDNDGKNDIIRTSDWSGTHFNWYKNLGQGLFDKRDIYPSDNSYEYSFGNVIIKDINGDGNKDLVLQYGSAASSTFSWFLNDGAGNFTEKRLATNFYQGQSFNVEDMDGDGDMDFILSQQAVWNGSYSVVWFENLDGQGHFGPLKMIDSNAGYEKRVYVKDMDSDGDTDIIIGNEFTGTLEWYENLDRHGNFAQKRTLIQENGFHLNSVFFDDIDNDGYVDILASVVNDGYLNTVKTDKVVYYKNLGPAFNKINGYVRAGLHLDDCNLPVNNLKVITNSATESLATFTTKTGYYQFYVDPGTYTTTIPTTLRNFNVATPTSHHSTFTGIGNIDVANFCLNPTQITNDLNVVLVPLSRARPGFDAAYQIVFNNVGNTQLSGRVKLDFNGSKLTFNSASVTPSLATNNSLSFDYLNLNPFETRTINLTFKVLPPPTVEINNILTYSLTIDPIVNDATSGDNTHIFNQLVVGSYDPNDITCFEGEKISLVEAQKELHYVIRFQNTGTASAINVKVENTLDDKLDWNTFQLINSSHANRVEIKNGNKVSFFFDKINLPRSSSNEAASHGFVAYKIKPKANVQIGDVFPNKGDIFFDYNAPITTNTALTKIEEEATNNSGSDSNQFNFYPLPISDVLTIGSKNKIVKIEILNELGQEVLSNSNQNSINTTSLSTGLYICRATDENNNSEMKKVIKK